MKAGLIVITKLVGKYLYRMMVYSTKQNPVILKTPGQSSVHTNGTNIPFIADWKKIGEHGQRLTDLNTTCENKGRSDYDYKVGQKILVRNKGILCKPESRWQKDPWTITTVHTNGTITVQHGNKEERLNIRRVKLFEE